MSDNIHDHNARIRLLECWMPLAQETNQLYHWGYGARMLEELIIQAAPDLNQAHTFLEARVILWHYYIHNNTNKNQDEHNG